MASGVSAQQPAATGTAADDTGGLQEIVVTANRVAQDIQKVGAAVQVVSGDSLSSQALTNIGAIFADTPSVNITAQPAGFSVNIRGQMGDGPSGKQQGAVASEFDGIYNITSLSTEVGFFDMDRMEVLPGPQSTQYGPNADGGVVNAISKDPVFGSWEGRGSVTYGNYNLRRGEFGQNIPINDTLALRVSGAMIDRGSYTEPATANQIAQSGRAKLLWQPSDNFSVKAWIQLDHMGGTGQGLEPYIFNVEAFYPYGDINKPSFACSPENFKQYPGLDCANPWAHGNSDNNGTTDAIAHANLWETTYAATVSWHVNDAAVLDVTPSEITGSGTQTGFTAFGPNDTGYNTSSSKYNPGYTYGETVQYPFDPFHEFATEVRLHNSQQSKIVWAVGYYLWHYKDLQWSTPQGPPYAVGPLYGNYSSTFTNAAFGDVTYPVTDAVRVIVGARYSRDSRVAHQTLGPDDISVGNEKFHHFDYRVGEQIDLGANAMQYFTLTTGYRPGGLNYQGNTGVWSADANEVNTALELGIKSRVLDNRLQLNGDVFYYIERNYQNGDNYTQSLPEGVYNGQLITPPAGANNICYTSGPGQQAPAVCNLPAWQPDVHALGVETQIKFDATRDDHLSLNATYEKSEFRRGSSGCATVDNTTIPASQCAYGYNPLGNGDLSDIAFVNIQGLVTAHSPEWAGNLGYNRDVHLGSYNLNVGGEAFYSDWYYAHPAFISLPPGLDTQPAYWLFNLNASLTPADSFWSLNAYVHNVRNYAVKESYFPSGTLGDPRLYGVTLNLKW